MRPAVSWLTGVIVAFVVAVPSVVLAVTIINRTDHLEGITRTPTPLVVEPSAAETDGATEATLIVRLAPGLDVYSGGATGRVTAVAITEGTTVRTGDAIYDVDGVARIAAHTVIPFHRVLAPGSVGEDVVVLKELLQALGVGDGLDPADARYDASTGRAVRELRRALRDPDPSTSFTPDLVVWLPTPEITVATVLVRPGSNAPALGEPVLRTAVTIAETRVEAPDGAPLPDELVGGPVNETATGIAIGELIDARGVVEADRVALLSALSAHLDDGAGDGGDPPSVRLGVTLRRSTPVDRQIVPASAVMTGADGRETCIWLETPDGWAHEIVAVHAAGQAGSVALVDELAPGARVLANPIEFLGAAACPSR